MAIICPTVLASDAHEYQTQMNRVASFAHRVQIDLTDGLFAKNQTVTLQNVWVPEGLPVDLHLMFKKPDEHFDDVLRHQPNLVIVHAEAEGKFHKISEILRKNSIQVGVALLPRTSTHVIKPSLNLIDHVLIFSGSLGKFGGVADLKLLDKVKQLKEWKPDLEIGWDGGVNDQNAEALARGGVDVLNVGGFIQKAVDPHGQYNKLTDLINKSMI